MQNYTVTVDMASSPPEAYFPPVFNVATAFIDRHVMDGRGGNIALIHGDSEISYGHLAENVNRCGNVLKDLGLESGDRLVMAIKDCPMFFYVFWGAIKAGIIPIPINTFLKAEDFEFLIQNSECRGFVYSDELSENTGPAAEAMSDQLLFAMPTSGTISLEESLKSASPDLEPTQASEDTECFWLYSSGSTGKPKGVVHLHRDMVITSTFYGQGIAGIKVTDTVYSASKLFFSYGFGGGMTFPLWAGATIVLIEETTNAALTFETIKKYKPDVFFGVPTIYAQQLHLAETQSSDMSSIRTALSAGEALPAHVFQQAKKIFDITILDGIGSTEVLHIFLSNTKEDQKPGTSGRVVPGYEVSIVDEKGRKVPDGEFGILHVKGKSNAKCYWKNPKKTASTMLGDWLNTGDVYKVDNEGYYVNAGRGDDMLKVGGMWCSPLEIEEHILRHTGVQEVAVVGLNDDKGLAKPAAYVVAKDKSVSQDELAEELRIFCKSGLAGYKYPRWFYFVDELPKTVTGKIQRFKLRGDQE